MTTLECGPHDFVLRLNSKVRILRGGGGFACRSTFKLNITKAEKKCSGVKCFSNKFAKEIKNTTLLINKFVTLQYCKFTSKLGCKQKMHSPGTVQLKPFKLNCFGGFQISPAIPSVCCTCFPKMRNSLLLLIIKKIPKSIYYGAACNWRVFVAVFLCKKHQMHVVRFFFFHCWFVILLDRVFNRNSIFCRLACLNFVKCCKILQYC